MNISANGLDLITRWEGLKLTRYICPAGKPTIGVGHVILPSENIPNTITREFAMELLKKDVERFEKAVNTLITVELNQNQFDALVCFIFNTGEGGLKNTGVSKAVNSKNFAAVPAALRLWNKIKVNGVSQENKGLTNRRISEAELFMRPVETLIVTGSAPTFVTFTPDLLKNIQTKLQSIGLYTIKIDGLYGPSTKRAIETFARNNSIDYVIDPKQGIRSDILDMINKIS
jgi:lysozyme